MVKSVISKIVYTQLNKPESGGFFMKKTTAVKIFLALMAALSLLGAFVSSLISALAAGACIFGFVTLWKRSRESQ